MFVSHSEIKSKHQQDDLEFTLKGLLRGSVGMLIAAPNIGKSHLALSIAIEYASSATLLGLAASDTPLKALLISTEDSEGILAERIIKKTTQLGDEIDAELDLNLSYIASSNPLVSQPSSSHSDKVEIENYVQSIAKHCKSESVSLIIVDTVSEAVGALDEVKDDKVIKLAFQKLAREANAAVLLVHHINKSEIRGDADVSMASGAGLSSIMRLTKLMLTMTINKEGKRQLSFLKCNYLNATESKPFVVDFVDSLLVNKSVMQITHGADNEELLIREAVDSIFEGRTMILHVKDDDDGDGDDDFRGYL